MTALTDLALSCFDLIIGRDVLYERSSSQQLAINRSKYTNFHPHMTENGLALPARQIGTRVASQQRLSRQAVVVTTHHENDSSMLKVLFHLGQSRFRPLVDSRLNSVAA